MPIDEMRAASLEEGLSASTAFRSTLPHDLRESYDKLVGTPIKKAIGAARTMVDRLDELDDPEAPAVNNPGQVAADAIRTGDSTVNGRLSEARQGVDRLGPAIESRALPPEPSGVALSNTRETVRTVVGDLEGPAAGAKLRALMSDPDTAGALLSSAWGAAFLDSKGLDRSYLIGPALEASAAGRYGPSTKPYAAALGAWGSLNRAVGNAGAATVVVESERKRRSL